ncbi:MAG: FAD-dependent oxidoreductase, partial [Alphaproteobacteria bacterium]|nr:FAD-dependent oxidoreductase [Alphaproteobacteria bacterium]
PRKAMKALREALPEIKQALTTPETLARDFDLVIDCRGMGAKSDLMDLRGVKGEILIVHNPEFNLNRPIRIMHPRYPLYIVPRDGNLFMIGATIIESEDNENVSLRSAMELQSALYSLHPSFAESEILEMSAGIRPAYADNMPEITIRDNIIYCNGLFRHGFLLSPIIAQSIADYIQGQESHDLHLFMKDKTDADITKRQTLRA